MRKLRLITTLAVVGLALLAACEDSNTPTPSPSPTPPEPTTTATVTATSTTTPTPAATATVPSNVDALFCEVKRDGLVGFLRHNNNPRPAECSGNGFVIGQLAADLNAQLAVGRFVPRCFQPAEGGLQLIVGALCHYDAPHHTFTTDPRPPELRGQLADGDLIPWCAVDYDEYPDYPITVGPPCVTGGEGPLRIALDEAPIQAAANCTAGFTYLSRSETTFRQLLDILPTSDQPTSFDAYRGELTPARDALAEAAPERVRQYFALWTDELSPISTNLRIVEALDALASDSRPASIEELRQQLADAIDWYTGGRGC